MFTRIWQFIRGVIAKVIPFKSIEAVERIETPISSEMAQKLDDWYDEYRGKASWLGKPYMRSLNLPAFISCEIARQIVLEMEWNISGTEKDEQGGNIANPRSEYLKAEFDKCIKQLRLKLEQGCAAGGMTIKPYPKEDGHIYFDFTMDWSLYPISFDGSGHLCDVIFRDTFVEGKIFYTRLERHRVEGKRIHVTHRAFKSTVQDMIGTEIPLSDVPIWSDLEREVWLENTDGLMFGWYKTAIANNVDTESPMGVSVFSRAEKLIADADEQYSRLMWEYEGSELAIDVDPSVLRPKKVPGANGKSEGMEMPRLNERLFRGVDMGQDDTYKVFSPPIRDGSLLSGLGQILCRIEDQCGLSRGTLVDAPADARTATELKILKQRTYTTITGNQESLEACLRDVVRAMDKYASLYKLAPEGDYEVSFEWDDSIITDTNQQMLERVQMVNLGAMSVAELREWYLGETPTQAAGAIQKIKAEQMEQAMAMAALQQETEP